MSTMEIVLLIIGCVIFILSFLIPSKKEDMDQNSKTLAKDEIQKLVSKEMEQVRGHVDDVVEEAVNYAMEKTERSLERLTNEKIMAVNEYSDTVLKEIHQNREEVMFLYDMLNDKHANLKDTVTQATRTVKEVEETTKEAEAVVNSFQRITPEVVTVQTPMQEEAAASTKPRAKKAEAKIQPEEEQKPAVPKKKTETKPAAEKRLSAKTADVQAKTQPAGLDISFTGETGRNKNEQILALYKQGKSNVAIAKELGLGVGEVKLVIDLYKNL